MPKRRRKKFDNYTFEPGVEQRPLAPQTKHDIKSQILKTTYGWLDKKEAELVDKYCNAMNVNCFMYKGFKFWKSSFLTFPKHAPQLDKKYHTEFNMEYAWLGKMLDEQNKADRILVKIMNQARDMKTLQYLIPIGLQQNTLIPDVEILPTKYTKSIKEMDAFMEANKEDYAFLNAIVLNKTIMS